MPTIKYNDILTEQLQDPEFAADYLTECLEDGEESFLLAVRDIVRANASMTELAKSTNLNREGLYDMLSEEGNPRLNNITNIIDKLGFQIKFCPKLEGTKAA